MMFLVSAIVPDWALDLTSCEWFHRAQMGTMLRWWQILRASFGGTNSLDSVRVRYVSRVLDVWGKPSADSEFRASLEKLAVRAWSKQSRGGSSQFLFKPEILLTREEEVLNKALVALYDHARRWVPGLEIPYRVPRLRIAKGGKNAGQFEVDEDGWLAIDLSAEFLDVPKAIWLILAHEVCHHILEQSSLADRYNAPRNERLTDTAMFVCGFGNLAKAGQTLIRRTASGYLKTHLGYLKPAEYSYAYHWVIATRCANRSHGMDGVVPDYPQVAGGTVQADGSADVSPAERLKILVPDLATRKRLFDQYQSKFPGEMSSQTSSRIIDSIEMDNR